MYALLADALTMSRVVAAGVLVCLGLGRGRELLSTAVLVTVLAWTSDQLDGWAARRSSVPTRLGRHDFEIDVVFYAGILAYLVAAGFVPVVAAAVFAAISLIAWSCVRRKSIAVLCLRIVDLTGGVVVFTHVPWIGAALVLWLALLAVVYRRRLAQRVPRWLHEVGELVRHKERA